MKYRNRFTKFALLTAGAALAFAAPAALAQHDHSATTTKPPAHGADGHSHGAQANAPETYANAVAEMASRAAEVEAALNNGDLDAAHDEGDAIAAIARTLGALALKPDSGVAKDQVKAANLAGKAIAEQMDAIHDAGEKKDIAGAKAAFAKGKVQIDSLSAAAPATYYCPMHCEGAKTYDKPAKCPVCSMNLKKQTSDKFTMDVKPVGGKIIVGEPATMVFTIKDPTGLPVKKLEEVHENLLHLLMVSKDLAWYAHEHPEIKPDGTFTFTYTFPEAGEFVFYNDFTPPNVGQQVVQVLITVEGAAPAKRALTVDADKPKTIDGYTVSLDTGGPVKTGAATHMAYTVTKDGTPVTDLQPYLGAMGHLVIISENLKEFVHSHPHEEGAGHGAATQGGPKVDFEAHFKAPGVYKGWAQFQHMGKVITVPMTFNVAKGEASDGGHKHGAAPINTVCPITGAVADAGVTRDFKGQLVAFQDAASAARWDSMTDAARFEKLVPALVASAAAAAKAGHGDHADAGDGMPAGVDDAEARALYFTPGGKYTEADIKANGPLIAGDKYRGKMAKHDFKPKVGDAICPITLTKVNPKFTWIIGGKTYEFCCPPCIDEFVLLAKTSPEEIKEPSSYVKT